MSVNDGEVVKAVVSILLDDGTITNNVFHWIANLSAEVDNATVLAAVAAYLDDTWENLESILNVGIVFQPYYMSRVKWDDLEGKWLMQELIGSAASTVTPTNSDAVSPNQIAGTVRATTARPKSYGRKFIPGISQNQMSGSELVSGAVIALTAFMYFWLDDITLGGYGTLSPGVPRTAANQFLQFVTGEANAIVGTQRKRKPGVGS
jgi:hypothetical protein